MSLLSARAMFCMSVAGALAMTDRHIQNEHVIIFLVRSFQFHFIFMTIVDVFA